MSKRKRAMDREAGLVFAWRTRDASESRVIVAIVVAVVFWLAILAMLRIRPMRGAVESGRGADLTVVNLNADENRWLDEIVRRDVPFPNRWNLVPSAETELWVEAAALGAAPPSYVMKFPEIEVPEVEMGMDFQAILGRWPLPKVERVPAEKAVAAGNLAIFWSVRGEKDEFSWELPLAGEFALGERFRFYLGLDETEAAREVVFLQGGFPVSVEKEDFLREKMAGQVFDEVDGKKKRRWIFLEGEVREGGKDED